MENSNLSSAVSSILSLMDGEACLVDSKGKILAFNEQFSQQYKSEFNQEISIGDASPEKIISSNKAASLYKQFSSDTRSIKFFSNNNTTYKPLILSNQLIGIVCQTKEVPLGFNLNRDEENFMALFEQASDSIMITDFKGNILKANASFCNQFGYSMDELLHSCITELIDKEELESRPLRFDNLNTGVRVFSRRKMLHKNGTYIYVEANLKKFGENQVLAIVKDITEIKNALTQIEISDAQFKGAFENAAIGMALVALDANWIKINKEFCSIMGYTEQELFQLTFKDFTHPEDFPICVANLQKIIMGEMDTWKTEKRYMHKNGHYNWINFNASMVRDSKGNPLFLVAQFENISKRKEEEIQKEKMSKDLLLQMKNLEQFTYIVSHNLRAPVANLIGLSRLLKDESYPIEVRNKCINELETSSQRLDEIIHDLNNILQIKREITEKKELVQFSTLVDHIQLSIQNILQKEQVKIITDFNAIEFTSTLKSYLYSIFFNLITNSIKYRHPDRTPIISISSKIENNKITLHFNDNGMGMDLEKYGEQFFGLYKRFHLQIEGKGIGLFVVKTQVETLGGQIEAYGKVNEGMNFRIELPL